MKKYTIKFRKSIIDYKAWDTYTVLSDGWIVESLLYLVNKYGLKNASYKIRPDYAVLKSKFSFRCAEAEKVHVLKDFLELFGEGVEDVKCR